MIFHTIGNSHMTKWYEGGAVSTLMSRDYKDPPITAYRICSKYSNSMMSDNPHSGCYEAETSITVDTSTQNPDKNQGGIMVLQQPAYGIDRAAFNQGTNAQYKPQIDEEMCQSMVAKDPNAVAQPYAIGNGQADQTNISDKVGALNCMHDQQAVMTDYIVRQLTPKECCRLQGFFDWWCDDIAVTEPTEEDMQFWREVFNTYAELFGKKPKTDNQIKKWLADPHTDSAEYKMWGNGVALPCVYFVMSGIAEELTNDKT